MGHELMPVLVSSLYEILLQLLNHAALIKLGKTDKTELRMLKNILRKVRLNINAKYKSQKTSNRAFRESF